MKQVVMAAIALMALAGCASDDETPAQDGPTPVSVRSTDSPTADPGADPAAAPVGPQYVALGDSYQAAPGVPTTSGADGCFRSSSNYAQLLALDTGLTITDVTCSGATTDTVLEDQVPAITPEAELVTVGIGGNDFDLYTRLIGGCLDLAAADPEGMPCTDATSADVERTLPDISDNVGGVLDAIAAAAPDARVVVVGYPNLLPTSGSCPDRIAVAEGDYPFLNSVTEGLSAALREQADRLGFDFVDLTGPSRGHDICSDDPWVNGASMASDGTIPFHPFGVEQQAVAAMIAKFL